ncbi:MAG: tyrosine-type recombinase/integrase [Deltaproteobacteria bacterium]|nr:tyrosine-type recombinase/integrase [Deltaproteobacteria bacterium]
MSTEPSVSTPNVNPLSDIDFDVSDANGWYRYVADSLVLTGLSRSTGETYAREVRILVRRFGRPPFMLTEGQIRTFILERHKKLNGSSQRILYCGLRFLYYDLFKYDWELLKAVRGSYETIEPTIISRAEVARLFACIETPHIYAYLRTVYSCGLRLSEALHIRPGDIDRDGGLLHIRQGKGAKDRKVVLPSFTLRVLGRYWRRHRNPRWLFPALGRSGKNGPTAEQPMSVTAVQGGLRRHLKRAGITKSRVTIHSLRHAYATHLLDAGVPLTVLQQQLGHENIQTTLRYVHLSKTAQVDSAAIVNKLMGAIR